jgi:2-polyprenyl-3-methyl-5-hydroxy-6-metoxy-1,4-benzoquinol methylase
VSKYDLELDLNSNNSLSLIINMIKPNTKILEFGPATGRLTKYLNKQMKCKVDIVEIDKEAGLRASEYSNKSLLGEELGDIEKYKWIEELKNDKYDYIIFADVLEHLQCPKNVLKNCNRVLKDEGSIIVSVPNIAHNSVVIDLINDEFKYNNLGLLDNTHIKFFTYHSLKRMIYETGYETVVERAVYSKVGDNEINNSYASVNNEFARELRKRKNGNLYQFIFGFKKKENAITQTPIREFNLDINSEYEFVCYIKDNIENQYNENKTIRKFINPNHNIIKLDFSNFKEINELRIDPITSNCIINIKNMYTLIDDKKVKINISYTNGINLFESIYIFSTNDPQIYLDLKGIDIKNLYYECVFIDFDSENISKYDTIINKILKNNAMQLDEKENVIKEQEDTINKKEDIINEKENMIKEQEEIINKKENIIKEQEDTMNKKEGIIKEKQKEINIQYKKLEEVENIIEEQSNKIKKIENSRSWIYLSKLKRIIGR